MNEGSPPRPAGVYVHFPFCAKRCHYCDFSVARSKSPPVDDYLAALEADLREWLPHPDRRHPIETIYVGGGTPSLLGAEGMRGLAGLLETRFSWGADVVEWTAEANPNSLTPALATAWRELGVNRLSLGVQSFHDEALGWLGRLHDAEEAERAIRTARHAGFERINVDLIFGLPAGVRRDWVRDVGRAVELGATHVSAYGLSAEPRTPLGRWVDLGRVQMPADSWYAEDYLRAVEVLVGAGFEHYEVSNFGLPGQASRHNWLYWDGSNYLGVGPSAHSFLAGERIWNVFRWDRYRKAVNAGESVREGREIPDVEQRRLERIWLDLRTSTGLSIDLATDREAVRRVESWRQAGWLVSADPLRLSAAGWLRLDAIAAEVSSWSVGPVLTQTGNRH
jgi:oxygen-independent coproporphyrinogen-3 oxidase